MINMLYDMAKQWLKEHEEIKGAIIISTVKNDIGYSVIEHKGKIITKFECNVDFF